MLTIRFDNDVDFFAWLTEKGGTPERYHTQYPVDDPPTIFIIYPMAYEPAGPWLAVLDASISSEDVRWQDSQRISGWNS